MKYLLTRGIINRDWKMIILIYLMVIALGYSINTMISFYVQEELTSRTVQAVCDYAHSISDGGSEEACGLAQDASHREYLCANPTVAARCWVEIK